MGYFKLITWVRNLTLANAICWILLDFTGTVTLEYYTSSINGLMLFITQYIVFLIGNRMTGNSNNRKNSALKNALICTGMTLNENVSEESIRKRYSGRNVRILLGLPLVGILTTVALYSYIPEPTSILFIYIFASITIAVHPIYKALVDESNATASEAND